MKTYIFCSLLVALILFLKYVYAYIYICQQDVSVLGDKDTPSTTNSTTATSSSNTTATSSSIGIL